MMPSTLRLKKIPENKPSLSHSQNPDLPSSLRPKKQQQFPFEGENDLEREIERNVAQQTSRIGETLVGAPGDIYSFVKSVFGGDSETNLPTSKSLREQSEKLSQGYTKPKNEFEERIGEVQQDIASFLVPGSNQYSMLRNIGIPIVANLAKEGIKYTGNEKIGESAKVGLMIVLDLMSQRQGGAKKFASGIFNKMEERIPEGRWISAETLLPDIKELKKEFSFGGSKPSTEKSMSKLSELENSIKNGKIELKNLVKYRPAINEIIDDLGGFEYLFKPKQKEKIINNLQKVKNIGIKATEDYAKKFDPELLKLSRSGNEAWAAYEKSNKIGEFLNKHFGNKVLGKGVKTLLGIGAPALGLGTVGGTVTAAAGIPLTVVYQGVKLFSRIKNSPTLRKYYGSVLKASLAGNISQASRSLEAINKELEEQDQE